MVSNPWGLTETTMDTPLKKVAFYRKGYELFTTLALGKQNKVPF